jgi:hypothetical protein
VRHFHLLGGGQPAGFAELTNGFGWPMIQSLVKLPLRGN